MALWGVLLAFFESLLCKTTSSWNTACGVVFALYKRRFTSSKTDAEAAILAIRCGSFVEEDEDDGVEFKKPAPRRVL